MSSADTSDRDLEAEADQPEAGHAGIPVDAVCTGCQQVRVKRVNVPTVDDLPRSFQTVCHRCQIVQWWNVVSILFGLIDGVSRADHGGDDDE